MSRINLGRALHGLGACEFELSNMTQAISLNQSACDLYRDEAPELFHLALQNIGMAHLANNEYEKTLQSLEKCARFWTDQGNASRVHEIETLLAASRG